MSWPFGNTPNRLLRSDEMVLVEFQRVLPVSVPELLCEWVMLDAFVFREVEHGWYIPSGTFSRVSTGQGTVRRVATHEGAEVTDSSRALGSGGRVSRFSGTQSHGRTLKLD